MSEKPKGKIGRKVCCSKSDVHVQYVALCFDKLYVSSILLQKYETSLSTTVSLIFFKDIVIMSLFTVLVSNYFYKT